MQDTIVFSFSHKVCFPIKDKPHKLILKKNRCKSFAVKNLLSGKVLTCSLILHFEIVPNSKKLQTTTEMWLFLDTECIQTLVEIGKIAHFEQFHLYPQCFPKANFFNSLPNKPWFLRVCSTSLLKTQ